MSMNSNWFQNGQPSKLEEGKNVRFTSKKDIFFDLPTLTAGHFETVGAHRHNVPYFKVLIMVNLDFEAQGHGSTNSLYHALLKKRRFIGKTAIVRRLLSLAVYM